MRCAFLPLFLLAQLVPVGLGMTTSVAAASCASKATARLAALEADAGRGDAVARFRFARALYRSGDQPVRAYAEMRLAAMAGAPGSQKALEHMRRRISLADRAQALDVVASRLFQPQPVLLAETPVAAPRLVAGWWPSDEGDAQGTRMPAIDRARPRLRPAILVDRADTGWTVQLGAFRRSGGAERHWAALGRGVGSLGTMKPRYVAAGGFTRLQLAGLDREQAQALCARILAGGGACFALAPRTALRVAAATYAAPKQI